MKKITATECARNFSRVLDSLQNGTEEVIIVRNRKAVARLVPGVPAMTALEALSDLHRVLLPEEAREWLKDAKRGSRRLRKDVRDPWQ